MRNLATAARNTKTFIAAVDHFGKAVETGTRGSSAKESNADVVLALLGDKDITGKVTNTRLAIRKRRNGANGEEFPFAPRVVNVGNGGLLSETTLVLNWDVAAEATLKRGKASPWKAKSVRQLHQALLNALAMGGSNQKPFPDGPVVRAVDIELARSEFYKSYPAEGDAEAKANARRQAFGRVIKTAQHGGLIGIRDIGSVTFVWLAAPEEPSAKAHS
jgi:hypothetical protein